MCLIMNNPAYRLDMIRNADKGQTRMIRSQLFVYEYKEKSF